MCFREECANVRALLREQLGHFGEIDSGDADFLMGPDHSSDRAIGIVTKSPAVFEPGVIGAVKNVLAKVDQDFLVYFDGEYDPGEGFYICITKAEEVLGYAENPQLLEPFGFA
jgi:hypothetical protein